MYGKSLTTAESVKLIGMTGTYTVNSLHIEVMVDDVKQAYGSLRLLIAPMAGCGKVWVMADSVQLHNVQ